MTKMPRRRTPGPPSAKAALPAAETGDEETCPRLRIRIGRDFVLGPGKVDLIEEIGRSGSISAAGRAMGMSYKRAWQLVDALNRMFPEPVIVASIGGAHGGGATLTPFGRSVAAAYRRAEERVDAVVREEFGRICVAVA
jgi:molybdate transport system regulatory protein